jgi:AcrR family transcriptional regulator
MTDSPAASRRPSVAIGKVLDAAEQVFAERGFAGARIDEIAARAGLAKSHVYYHFAGKQQIFDALVEARLDELLRGKAALLDQFEDAMPRTDQLGPWLSRAVGELLAPRSAFLRIVLVETLAPGGREVPSLLSRVLTPVLDDIASRFARHGEPVDEDQLRSDALWFGLVPAVLHVLLLDDAADSLRLPAVRVTELFLVRLTALEQTLLAGHRGTSTGEDHG